MAIDCRAGTARHPRGLRESLAVNEGKIYHTTTGAKLLALNHPAALHDRSGGGVNVFGDTVEARRQVGGANLTLGECRQPAYGVD